MRERLQKILSSRGLMSRRAAETLIASGGVAVDGIAARLGDSADPDLQLITVKGEPLPPQHGKTYIMLNKPRGYTSTLSDPHAKKTVRDLLPPELGYLVPVGRLDKNSEGLLMMTNDGDAVRRLTHPSSGIEKEYHVKVAEQPEKLVITITEGKKHQVRNMCKENGLTVIRLIRVREGKLRLGSLKPGAWRALTAQEAAYVRGE